MKVLVCVKRVVDPNVRVHVRSDGSGMALDDVRMAINPFDEVAVEEAVRLKEAGLADEVVAVSVGSAACRDILRTALAMGADHAILLEAEQELESLMAARCLAAVVGREAPDLVLMGKQSTDHDLGQTAAMLAGILDWPQAVCASKIEADGSALRVTVEMDRGAESIELPLPAVVSADLRLNTPRFASLPAVMKAKKKPLETWTLGDLGLADMSARRRIRVVGVAAPPSRGGCRILPDVEALLAALREDRVL